MTPDHGAVGTAVRLVLSSEVDSANTSVDFNGVAARIIGQYRDTIIARVPRGATAGKVTVAYLGNTVRATSDFVVDTGLSFETVSLAFGGFLVRSNRHTIWHQFGYCCVSPPKNRDTWDISYDTVSFSGHPRTVFFRFERDSMGWAHLVGNPSGTLEFAVDVHSGLIRNLYLNCVLLDLGSEYYSYVLQADSLPFEIQKDGSLSSQLTGSQFALCHPNLTYNYDYMDDSYDDPICCATPEYVHQMISDSLLGSGYCRMIFQ